MRNKLKKLGNSKRYTFIGKIAKFSFKKGYRNNLPLRTVLLVDVRCNGEVVTNHIWMTCGRRIYSLLPQVGQYLEFDARVTKYIKGYYKDVIDYRLSYPSKIKVLKS